MQSSGAIYRRLLGHVKPYWKGFVLTLAATGLAAATEPLFPALLKLLLDEGFRVKEGSWLVLAPAAVIGVFMVRGTSGFLASYGMSWVSNKVVADLRNAMFAQLIRLPTSYFDAGSSSTPITKIVYDVTGVSSAATAVITVLVRDTLMVLGLLAWLLFLNWKLTLVSVAIMPVIALIARSFSNRLRSMSRASQVGMSRLNQVLMEAIRGQKVIKIFGGEHQVSEVFSKVNNALRGYAMRQNIAAAAISPLTQVFASFGLALVIFIAQHQTSLGEATIGGFVSFVTAMLLLLAPLKRLTDINAPLQRGLAASESVFQMLDEAGEPDHGSIVLGRVGGAIKFSNVRMRYPMAERDALAGVSLVVHPGETIALVGPSGSGKSSLANLVPRFYSPTAGSIRVDGHDIEQVTLASLRANIAHVGQDVFLFDDTVAANIAYGARQSASRADIEAAASAAHATDFINELPGGFEAQIGENGSRLSGGQRQRLAIARALLKDAPILILDEATSALDSESERVVQSALDTLMQGRTTLVIAHRLSTIEGADRIVVLANGHVTEIGSHNELMAAKGLYANLRRLQYAEEAGS